METKIEKKVYNLRILEAEEKQSKKGNSMIVCTCEIIASDNEKINGLKVTHYVTLTEANLKRFNDFCYTIGLPGDITKDAVSLVDLKQMAFKFINQTFFAVLEPQEIVEKNEQGEPLINPHTQEPMIHYGIRLATVCDKPRS